MTDPELMEADCIHGVVWYECKECDRAMADDQAKDRAHDIGRAYEATAEFLHGFDVNWMTDEPKGLMLHCRICGVHDFRPVETLSLMFLVESAFGHRQVCP